MYIFLVRAINNLITYCCNILFIKVWRHNDFSYVVTYLIEQIKRSSAKYLLELSRLKENAGIQCVKKSLKPYIHDDLKDNFSEEGQRKSYWTMRNLVFLQ